MSIIIRVVAPVIFALWHATVPALAQESISLKVLGQPLAAGPIQKNVEQPFFETLAKEQGLPLIVEYVPANSSGFSDIEALSGLRSGQVQIAALRMSQVGRQQPIFLGSDLVGLNTDYKSARQVIDAYTPVLDKWLQEKLGVRLLGIWPFGPEILFCNKPIAGLSDIKGVRVRVYDADSARLVESAGGVPVQLSFAATHQGLSTRSLDCAIGSPTAAVSSGWPEATTHVLPIALQLGINAYGMTLSAWHKLKPDQQDKLMLAFRSLTDQIWGYSEQLSIEAINCSIGKAACASGKKFQSEPSASGRCGYRIAQERVAECVVSSLGRDLRQGRS